MTAAAIPPLLTEDLQAHAASSGTTLKVSLTGSAEMGAKPGLDRFFADVLAADGQWNEVVVDVRDLQFMNSSCFKSVLTWIVRVQERPAANRYKIRFLSNPHLHWQKRSLHSLASMGGGLVEVHEDGTDG